jgi:hypothetical protein
MDIRNSGRHLRLAGAAIGSVVENTNKLVDAPSLADKLERTHTTVTPAANQYVILRRIEGEVSGDATLIPPNSGVVFFLSTNIVGVDGSNVSTATRTITNPTGHTVDVTDCTLNQFTAGSRDLSVIGAMGASLSVQFYLRYATTGTPSAPASMCLQNTRIIYDLVTRVRRT